MPPFKQPDFSAQQSKGRFVDMHQIYNQFINLCKTMDSGNKDQGSNSKFHDYLWFLQNMDKFDDFPLNRKFKHQHKYITYLQKIQKYLTSFIVRSKPLFDLKEFAQKVDKKFEEDYENGHLPGWQFQNDNLNIEEALFCPQCKKLFINNQAYVSHSASKKHQKMYPPDKKNEIEVPDHQEQQLIRKQFKESHLQRKKSIAIHEYRIHKMRQQLATPIYDTMNLVRKKQTRGYEDIDQIAQSSSDQQQDDAPIYNPKNLPLGWDGKPIPYWLYRLHGLGIQYKCQICGNFSYWGRRAFEMHFQEWRHNYGMRCLKIPNTIHFKDITTISDALALHQKLLKQSRQSQFRPEIQEEYQDNEGNILDKRTYFDMKKQGLID